MSNEKIMIFGGQEVLRFHSSNGWLCKHLLKQYVHFIHEKSGYLRLYYFPKFQVWHWAVPKMNGKMLESGNTQCPSLHSSTSPILHRNNFRSATETSELLRKFRNYEIWNLTSLLFNVCNHLFSVKATWQILATLWSLIQMPDILDSAVSK